MVDNPTATPARDWDADDRRALAWLFSFVRPHLGRLITVLLLSALATGVLLVQPYLIKLIIDRGIIGEDLWLLGILIAGMMAAGLLNLALGGLNRYLHVALSGRVLFTMREAVYGHLQRLSPAYFARVRGGDLLARIDGDVAELQRFGIDAVLTLVGGVLGLVGSVALMVWLDWRLAAVALVLLPAEFLYLRMMRPKVEGRTRTVRERVSDISAFLLEKLPAIKFIQSIGAEARETRRLAELNRSYLDDLLRLQVTEFFTSAVPNFMVSASRALVFLAGGWLIIVDGSMTLGTLIAFSSYLGYATGPVQSLLGIYVGVMRMRVSLRRVMELTFAAPDVREPEGPRRLPADARGALRFEGVSFRYPGSETPVLTDVSLAVPAGAKVGVVGESGAGKTTFIDLLHRHYDPEAGRILLDDVDIRDLGFADLRRHVGVVAQDVVLFRGSVRDNIRYAAPEADDRAVEEAAQRAQIDDFIRGLPEGYDTPIGERGTRLSGGQRQRLAIARAVLQDPLVLVLDEATSAVDRETESRLTAEIDRLFAGRTRIVITHRRDALHDIDLLVEIAGGRIHDRTPPAVNRRGVA